MSDARWIDDDAGVRSLASQLVSAEAYAIDTEFHREKSYFPHLALVQVAWEGGIVLIDAPAVDLHPLADVFAAPPVAVLHAADQDLEVLGRSCGAVPGRIFDTQVAAGFLGFSTPSLTTLAEKLLSIRLPKGDRLTDWTRRPLSEAQQTYAAADVAHLLEIRSIELDRLRRRGRLEWAEAECQLLLERARGQQDPETAWWRLKDGRSLRGQARPVAQAVAAWRERRAATLDLPPRFVLSDMALLGVANRRPQQRSELEEIRGLDGRQVRGAVGEELLTAVRTGLAMSDDALRLPPADEVDRQLRPAVTLVSAWVSQLGRDLDIDPTLLATRADVQALLRGDAGARLGRGWRAELVGVPVRRLVGGDAALAFDGEELVLEERSRRRLDNPPGVGT